MPGNFSLIQISLCKSMLYHISSGWLRFIQFRTGIGRLGQGMSDSDR
jgi:hypothetical protein